MHPYTKHLLEDISNSYKPKDFFGKKKFHSPKKEFKKMLAESESFMDFDKRAPFRNLCGLNFEHFPPAEKLEQEDLRELTNALVKMFESWNILVVLVENLPADMAYRITLDLLNSSMPVVQYGFFVIDFCTGDPTGCEFEGFCPCIKHWQEEQDKMS